ncbi:peptide ABC transporter substrate-binding protein [Calorimonas adulescens]|uniref:Peptide ABC transporter substrate-binding protein n=1 Tax=Calorimonas adulescens TaxID=2606906 RepID=A0A5D8QFG9_9THEO|nr:peptide ABC transporter substrate-binding protein [Calorimonas adulescens]TZE82874.1 peptide ABC transporter substrate-binding protein [Calorimonas adulescens]
MKRRFIIMLAALLVLSMALSACSGQTTHQNQESQQSGKQTAPIEITYNLQTEPRSVDPAKNTAIDGGTVIYHVFEGLTRLDKNNKAEPAVAEKWDVSSDGLTYTFHLRDGVKWSDGKPVTAKDFEYAWKRVLNPDTGSEYAYQLYYIKNGEKYNKGEAKAEDVGVVAKDDKTLELTLESPTPYILELLAFFTYMPVRQDIVEKDPDGWAQNPETYIGNGAFVMKEWNHNDSIVFEKNPNYWDAGRIKPDKLTFVMINDASTELAAFDNNQIDFGDNPPANDFPRLREDGVLHIDPSLATYGYVFNTKKAPFDNPKVRKAFSLAIDRKAIVETPPQVGQKPAGGWVPPGLPDADATKDFREIGGDYYDVNKASVEEAQKLLAEAGYPGGKGLPEITLLYNTSEGHKQIAEMLQEMWKKNLGVEVKLANEEWQVFLDDRANGNYQIARLGWFADYIDPMTFLDMFTTGSGNNDSGWSNKEYDDLIDKAKRTTNAAERMQYMHQAENILMDEMVVIPIYFYVNSYIVKPNLKGYHVDPLGYTYFHEAYKE